MTRMEVLLLVFPSVAVFFALGLYLVTAIADIAKAIREGREPCQCAACKKIFEETPDDA